MSTLYHPKFHRHNHHTRPTDVAVHPDSSYDPIASNEVPFQGDFYVDGSIVAKHHYNAIKFFHRENALLVNAPISVSAIGDADFRTVVKTDSFSIDKSSFRPINVTHTDNSAAFWLVYINNTPYGIRLWETDSNVSPPDIQIDNLLAGTSPYFLDISSDCMVHLNDIVSLTASIRGTHPLRISWYQDGFLLEEQNTPILYTFETGDYICVAENAFGVTSSTPVTVEFDVRPPVFEYVSPLTVVHDTEIVNTTLSAFAQGAQPIIYQWYFENEPLILTNTTHHTAKYTGKYFVTATNYVETVSSNIIEVVRREGAPRHALYTQTDGVENTDYINVQRGGVIDTE